MSKSTIEFDYHVNPGQDKDAEKLQYHARIVNSDVFDVHNIIERLTKETTVTNVDIVAVLEGVRQIIVDELASGNVVSLDGIGRFEPVLGMVEGVCNGTERGKELTLKTVKFRPQRALVNDLRLHLKKLTRRKAKHSTQFTEIDLYRHLSKYFQTHESISRKEMEKEFNLTRYMATKFINQFMEEGRLVHPGNRNDSQYKPAPGFFGTKR